MAYSHKFITMKENIIGIIVFILLALTLTSCDDKVASYEASYVTYLDSDGSATAQYQTYFQITKDKVILSIPETGEQEIYLFSEKIGGNYYYLAKTSSTTVSLCVSPSSRKNAKRVKIRESAPVGADRIWLAKLAKLESL